MYVSPAKPLKVIGTTIVFSIPPEGTDTMLMKKVNSFNLPSEPSVDEVERVNSKFETEKKIYKVKSICHKLITQSCTHSYLAPSPHALGEYDT